MQSTVHTLSVQVYSISNESIRIECPPTIEISSYGLVFRPSETIILPSNGHCNTITIHKGDQELGFKRTRTFEQENEFKIPLPKNENIKLEQNNVSEK